MWSIPGNCSIKNKDLINFYRLLVKKSMLSGYNLRSFAPTQNSKTKKATVGQMERRKLAAN